MSLDPLASPHGLRKLLQQMVDQGLVTIEDLDTPSKGYRACLDEMASHKVFELRSFKPVKPYANPLRNPDPDPVVKRSEPRDFTPTAGTTNPAPVDLPISLEEPDW